MAKVEEKDRSPRYNPDGTFERAGDMNVGQEVVVFPSGKKSPFSATVIGIQPTEQQGNHSVLVQAGPSTGSLGAGTAVRRNG